MTMPGFTAEASLSRTAIFWKAERAAPAVTRPENRGAAGRPFSERSPHLMPSVFKVTVVQHWLRNCWIGPALASMSTGRSSRPCRQVQLARPIFRTRGHEWLLRVG